jgi:hypothetical protein
MPKMLKMLEPTTLPMAMSECRREGGDQRRRQFRQAGADRDDRQADNRLADTDVTRNAHSAVDHETRAEHDARQPGERDQQAFHHAVRCLDDLALTGMHLGLGRAALLVGHQRQDDVEDQRGDQQEAAEPGERVQPDQPAERRGRHDDHRRVPLQRARIGHDRLYQRGGAQHQKDVGDVRAHDIADGDAHRARVDGAQAGHKLRHRGAAAHQGQADHELRNVQLSGDRDRATHQPLTAKNQEAEARQHQKIVHQRAFRKTS